ncbi:MAG: alpha/beta hydrolase [Alphaproteobacteria bacterium CG_4_9_14_3_um_filter_47_13]|nr:MAG: alpha/beta hydrolase [Alphaproteobacteria bacterium CG_4_9_14_3_um_filter_47_13]
MTKKMENISFRKGPSPIPVHIGLAMQHIGTADTKDMERMLAGIQKYQNHTYRRNVPSLPVIWQEGEASILHCAAETEELSIFLIPSLINKSFILDLLPEKSFVRWLAAQGINVYLMDWGEPVRDKMLQNIDSLVSNRLCAAMDYVTNKAGGKIHALGYCMGGMFLAAAAKERKEHLKSLIFLASPWDFSVGDCHLAKQVKAGTPTALQLIEQKGYLPMNWIQSVFAAVNADRALSKFSEFEKMAETSQDAHLFVAVEDWLNEGVDMPGEFAKSCILDWYNGNKSGAGEWIVNGTLVDPATLETPALVIASLNDRLVPRESSLALARLLPQAKILAPPSGHIGMMTGHKAEKLVWEPIRQWIREVS